MVASGVISRFTIELGEAIEGSAIEALVLLKVGTVDTRPLISRLKKVPAVQSFTSLNGQYDFALEVRAKSAVHLDETLAEIRRLEHISETNCSIRLKRFR